MHLKERCYNFILLQKLLLLPLVSVLEKKNLCKCIDHVEFWTGAVFTNPRKSAIYAFDPIYLKFYRHKISCFIPVSET